MAKPRSAKKSSKRSSRFTSLRTSQNSPLVLWRESGRFFKTAFFAFLIALALILLSIFWFYRSYEDPGNVFWGMVGDNLQANAVTKEVKQQTASESSDDILQLSFDPEPKLHAIRIVSSPAQKVSLTIESYNTAKDSYQHYLKIERPVAAGKSQPDYGQLYGLWLKNQTDDSTSSLFGNAIFGVTLIGDVPEPVRPGILASLQQAYQVDTKNVQVSGNGRRTFTYDVVIHLKDYAQAAHDYAQALGLPAADNIKPEQYKDSDKLQVSMSVDAASRHLIKVVYSNNSLTETYSGYGAVKPFFVPKHIVTPADFEKVFRQVLST